MTTNQDRLSSRVFGVVAVAIGVLAGWQGLDLIHGNDDAREVIVTVCSILAGFLIAIMTLLGDQSVLPGSWRIAATQSDAIRAKLTRQKWLFYCYLVTLSLIFVHTLIKTKLPEAATWIERFYFGFAATSFVLSFKLPATLMAVQTDRVEAVIAARRGNASKLDRS
ncbi:hypothetical protein [Sinorhizobium medicae]|uniref:hypothetical protein n=1 Tax=Sinorhizobium medicae TaxID=110321 RepID=UPI000FDC4336|nr:hypothetical protein [Sinorhizobium medicae]RVQ76100.1 hypothetical protein CN244_06215 [Sinorhizobium medicae]